MSLRQLCQAHELTIERFNATNTDAMGDQKVYSTTYRGNLPKQIRGRVVEATARDITDYMVRGINLTHKIYIEEQNPQVDERDRFIHCGTYMRVTGVRNPDRLNRYWIVSVEESRGGPL